MANDVRTSLRREIDRLQRAVSQKSTELKSLNDELKRYKGALELLGNGARGAAMRARKKRRPRSEKSAFVDWNAIFTRLPNSFTLKQFISRSEAKGKSPAYLRRIAAMWVKRGKTKRVRLGKYQKVEQKKLRAA
jgi:hypothetical protein